VLYRWFEYSGFIQYWITPAQTPAVVAVQVAVATAASAAVAAVPVSVSASVANSVVPADNDSRPAVAVVAASSGQVCRLCKRQFASAEMLLRHEQESKLHAENLAKQRTRMAASHQYRDRAEERREQFGSVADHLPARQSPGERSQGIHALDSTTNAAAIAPVVVAPLFDDSNPGNQMLRKMGWREGHGLGKAGDGSEEAVGVELAAGKNGHTSMHATLKGTSSSSSGGGTAQRGRESAQAVTRARFEQLQRDEGN
jgi:hypothetical protein